MPKYMPLTKNDLRERIKEIEDRIRAMDRREKMMGDLKSWMARRKLTVLDLQHMIKVLKPKRSAKAVKSKKPLQPLHPEVSSMRGKIISNGKQIERKGDPEFRRAIHEARLEKKLSTADLSKKIDVSEASISNWETGRYVPKEEARVKILKALNLPLHLGEEATKKMTQSFATRNGAG